MSFGTVQSRQLLVFPIYGMIIASFIDKPAGEKTICELQLALAEIKTLAGPVPICAKRKNLRDDKGFWNGLETFIEHRSEVFFTHLMCPDCQDQLYENQDWYIRRKIND